MKTFSLLGLAAAMAVTQPAFAQATTPAEYVKMAGASDLYEITSSRVVLQSTTDPKIRQFANMMIQHHTKSTADVKAAAKRAKLRPAPPMLMPDQQQMVDELRAASGTARDQAYITQQRTAHDKALALHQSYARDGTSAPLKMTAAKIVPVVQSHITMLQTM